MWTPSRYRPTATPCWTSDRPVDGRTGHDYDIRWSSEPGAARGASRSACRLHQLRLRRIRCFDGARWDVYFSSTRDGGANGAIEVYRSHLVNGTWSPPENVSRLIDGPTPARTTISTSPSIPTNASSCSAGGTPRRRRQLRCVRELESRRPLDAAGASRAPVNTPARDYAPHLSQDGRYLILSSERSFALQPIGHRMAYDELEQRLRATVNGSGNIYRMDLAAFDSLARASLPPDSSR